MLRFLSKVKLEYNALDPRAGTRKEFLSQCTAALSKDPTTSSSHCLKRMFREAGEAWPVVIPEEERRLRAPGVKPRKAEEKKQ